MPGVPELPEVETIRTQLQPRLSGRAVIDAGSHQSQKFTPALEAVGAGIGSVRRRGKYLIVELEDGRELVIHLGMTGRLAVDPRPDSSHPHLRAWWRLDDGNTFTFHDIRRFGRLHVVKAGCYHTIPTLDHLGPEPLEERFTAEGLWRALRASRRRVKTQLLSQRPVAGIGNIYADEALWSSAIDPAARTVSKAGAAALVDGIRAVLTSGLRHRGTTLRDYVTVEGGSGSNQHHLNCYGQAGRPCARCGTELRYRRIDARGTTWCPSCQRR